ncbi:hypothetical protein HPB50_004456 [Hyalomma asiaticum]|uniref:Uncharacterized protein n=1 Tax=Hyalomma asiaticum TaxID=266040 RepID=A0ACB7TIK7_HYAAI|nr:hypothetical protein HPB50_004456 [Hyalomma asiaticum]
MALMSTRVGKETTPCGPNGTAALTCAARRSPSCPRRRARRPRQRTSRPEGGPRRTVAVPLLPKGLNTSPAPTLLSVPPGECAVFAAREAPGTPAGTPGHPLERALARTPPSTPEQPAWTRAAETASGCAGNVRSERGVHVACLYARVRLGNNDRCCSFYRTRAVRRQSTNATVD